MATDRGFVPVRKLNGGQPIQRLFRVRADQNYHINDPVAINASGEGVFLLSADNTIPLGVISGLFKDDGTGKPKSLTFNQPTSGVVLSAAGTTPGWAMVNIDPDQVYVVKTDQAWNTNLIGKSYLVSAGTADDRAGRSGYSLAGSAVTGQAGQFMIIGLNPEDRLSGWPTSAATPIDVEVKLVGSNAHINRGFAA